MQFCVVTYPGSNCDRDCYHVIGEVLGEPVRYLRHWAEQVPRGTSCVVLPGGFSYGDYLRPGAIAARMPVTGAVADFAAAGGLVLGICNGFQILCEAGLLPGSLIVNDHLTFSCLPVHVRTEGDPSPFTHSLKQGEVLRMPIAHRDGNYRPPPDGTQPRVALRYCSLAGELGQNYNPNGSHCSTAAITNERGNVMGMMPHPERCAESILGGEDGMRVLQSAVDWWKEVGRYGI